MNTPSSLAEVRAEIDAIDSTMIELLATRQELVRAAAAFKRDEHAVRAPDRFAQLIASVRERADAAGLSADVAETIWRSMVGAFIELELAEHKSLQASE
ncbi:chorismate mutase [Nocardia lijiangensis]|uniref:chorismate mutase n=1 Tax=Nocardia lijiangensis TaxID=299618 RepID=UPI001C3F5FAF|nr:chorismate mutase [Nocardia lijiangensis]